MLVHYGHSCLGMWSVELVWFLTQLVYIVPTTETSIKTLYVFVEIAIDSTHLHHTIRRNFPCEREVGRYIFELVSHGN